MAYKTTFTNITVHNNSGTSGMIYTMTKFTEFKGLNVLSHNNKISGVDIRYGSLKIYPGSTIEFSNNKLSGGTLFHAEIRDQMTVGRSEGVHDQGNKITIIFTNNKVQLGGILVLETYVMYTSRSVVNITNTEINLENNTSTLVSDNYHPVTMMLKNLRRIEFKGCNAFLLITALL